MNVHSNTRYIGGTRFGNVTAPPYTHRCIKIIPKAKKLNESLCMSFSTLLWQYCGFPWSVTLHFINKGFASLYLSVRESQNSPTAAVHFFYILTLQFLFIFHGISKHDRIFPWSSKICLMMTLPLLLLLHVACLLLMIASVIMMQMIKYLVSLFIAELKMDLMREREMREQLEKQLVEERNLRCKTQKPYLSLAFPINLYAYTWH